MRENLHAKSYAASASPYVVDLRNIGSPAESLLVFEQANFDIEVVGNAAAVTLKAKGPFASSADYDVTDGTFAIAGAKKKLEDFSVGTLTFTSAATPFTVNITRKILD